MIDNDDNYELKYEPEDLDDISLDTDYRKKI